MIREERVKAVAAVLRLVPPEAIDAAETRDPQFAAIARIAGKHRFNAVAIVAANAIVSYRLNKHGEDYWTDYADFWVGRGTPFNVDELIESVVEFLRWERVPLLQQKVQRLRRARPLLSSLLRSPLRYRRIDLLYQEATKVMSRGRYQKTSAFAAKMVYYVFQALGVPVEGLEKIPVPLDRRFAVLTASSGMIPEHPDVIYSRLREEAERAWRLVAELSGHPPARLDTLLWLPARSIEPLLAKGLLGFARDEFAHRLVDYTLGRVDVKLARRIAEELVRYADWGAPSRV